MRKIPTVFVRDPDNRKYVLDEINPDCGWVFDGEGVPTRKYDGTCMRLDEHGAWWARREVKPGKQPPENFEQVNFDENTGKTMGWEPAEQSSFAKWVDEAVANSPEATVPGTYELVGPKVQSNPERVDSHRMIAHATADVLDVPALTFDGLKAVMAELKAQGVEGIVWHHTSDGRMAKLKVRDFQLSA